MTCGVAKGENLSWKNRTGIAWPSSVRACEVFGSVHKRTQPVPLVDSAGNLLLPKINEIIKKLDVQVERNYNDDEKRPETDRITGPAYFSHHHFIEENR